MPLVCGITAWPNRRPAIPDRPPRSVAPRRRHAMIWHMADNTEAWLVRHGETEWSRDLRHTSTTDLPLLPTGESAAIALAGRLAEQSFDLVLTSPRLRARRTAVLAGFPDAVVDDDLAEWDYGDHEGLTIGQIHAVTPGWAIWTDGGPHGESVDDVTARLDRVIARIRANGGRALCFSHGHALRVLAVRWIDRPLSLGRSLALGTTSVSVLADDRDVPVIRRWNS